MRSCFRSWWRRTSCASPRHLGAARPGAAARVIEVFLRDRRVVATPARLLVHRSEAYELRVFRVTLLRSVARLALHLLPSAHQSGLGERDAVAERVTGDAVLAEVVP